jgi:hypothetical protein
MRADDQDKSAAAPPTTGATPADKLFLGTEFLTWLYFTLEDSGFEVEVGGDAVQFAIGRRAVLSTIDATGSKVVLSGPDLDDSAELLQAVRRGAFLDQIALQMAVSERVYELSLTAGDGGLSIKVPDLRTEEAEVEAEDDEAPKRPRRRIDAGDMLDLRMMALDDVERVLDELFARFMTRRLARAWHSEDLQSMRSVIAMGLKARLAPG